MSDSMKSQIYYLQNMMLKCIFYIKFGVGPFFIKAIQTCNANHKLSFKLKRKSSVTALPLCELKPLRMTLDSCEAALTVEHSRQYKLIKSEGVLHDV